MSETEEEGEHPRNRGNHSNDSLEGMKQQIVAYERQLRALLDNLDAKIDNYNFSIQKTGDAVTIEFGLRTTIRQKRGKQESE